MNQKKTQVALGSLSEYTNSTLYAPFLNDPNADVTFTTSLVLTCRQLAVKGTMFDGGKSYQNSGLTEVGFGWQHHTITPFCIVTPPTSVPSPVQKKSTQQLLFSSRLLQRQPLDTEALWGEASKLIMKKEEADGSMKPRYEWGALAKYASLVGSASEGAVCKPTLPEGGEKQQKEEEQIVTATTFTRR
jgi:hypothetical protein